MRIAYIRVSTAEQNEQRQIEAMQKYNIEKWFIEKISAKDANHPKLQDMKGVHLISNKENIDTSTPTGKLMLTMIGAIAEFERRNLLDRQREGIPIAKREGRYTGGKRKQVTGFEDGYTRYKAREISKAELARELQISRPTLDKLIREYKEKT